MAEPPFTVPQAVEIVHRKGWKGNELDICIAAHTLMENCETDALITIREGLACLGVPGTVEACGARILYVLTGRDALMWQASSKFCTDRTDWINWLGSNGFDCDESTKPATS